MSWRSPKEISMHEKWSFRMVCYTQKRGFLGTSVLRGLSRWARWLLCSGQPWVGGKKAITPGWGRGCVCAELHRGSTRSSSSPWKTEVDLFCLFLSTLVLTSAITVLSFLHPHCNPSHLLTTQKQHRGKSSAEAGSRLLARECTAGGRAALALFLSD